MTPAFAVRLDYSDEIVTCMMDGSSYGIRI